MFTRIIIEFGSTGITIDRSTTSTEITGGTGAVPVTVSELTPLFTLLEATSLSVGPIVVCGIPSSLGVTTRVITGLASGVRIPHGTLCRAGSYCTNSVVDKTFGASCKDASKVNDRPIKHGIRLASTGCATFAACLSTLTFVGPNCTNPSYPIGRISSGLVARNITSALVGHSSGD